MRRASAFLVVAAFVASACSSGGGDGQSTTPPTKEPLAVISEAVLNSVRAGTVAFEMDMSQDFGEGYVTLSGKGELNIKKGVGVFTLDIATLLESFVGVPEGAPTKLRMVFTNTIVWLHVPSGIVDLPGGRDWLKVDATTFARAAAKGQTPFSASDPSNLFDILTGAVAAQRIGLGTVRDVEITKYEVIISSRKALESAAPQERAVLRGLTSVFGRRRFPMEVWVSADGFVRNETVTIPSQTGDLIFDVYYSGYGKTVTVERPPRPLTYTVRSLADLRSIFRG